jgi:hypothetical protein
VQSGFVAREDTLGVLLLSRGRRRRALWLNILLFALRLQDFTSVFLRLLRSARVCKRTRKPQLTRNEI